MSYSKKMELFLNIITSLTNIVTVNNDTNVFINIIKDITKLINIDCTCHKGKNLRKRHPELQKLLAKGSQNIEITTSSQPMFQTDVEQPDISQNTSFAAPDTQTPCFSSQPLPTNSFPEQTVYIDQTTIQSTSNQGYETGYNTQQAEPQQSEKSLFRGISRPMKYLKAKIPNLDPETELRIQKLLLANLNAAGGYEYVSEDEEEEPPNKRRRC